MSKKSNVAPQNPLSHARVDTIEAFEYGRWRESYLVP